MPSENKYKYVLIFTGIAIVISISLFILCYFVPHFGYFYMLTLGYLPAVLVVEKLGLNFGYQMNLVPMIFLFWIPLGALMGFIYGKIKNIWIILLLMAIVLYKVYYISIYIN